MNKVSINVPNRFHFGVVTQKLCALEIPFKFNGTTIIEFDLIGVTKRNVKAIFKGYIFKII